MYIDAFSIDWSDFNFYASRPILVVPRIMPKEKQDWSTHVWYSAMLKMLVLTPFLLNSRKSMLVLSQTPNQLHQI